MYTNNTERTAKKITSYDTADNFFWWLQENPQVTNIQGYKLERFSGGAVRSAGGYNFDMDWMWEHRKMLNDWIGTFCKGVAN